MRAHARRELAVTALSWIYATVRFVEEALHPIITLTVSSDGSQHRSGSTPRIPWVRTHGRYA